MFPSIKLHRNEKESNVSEALIQYQIQFSKSKWIYFVLALNIIDNKAQKRFANDQYIFDAKIAFQ